MIKIKEKNMNDWKEQYIFVLICLIYLQRKKKLPAWSTPYMFNVGLISTKKKKTSLNRFHNLVFFQTLKRN